MVLQPSSLSLPSGECFRQTAEKRNKAAPEFLKLYCDPDVVISKGQGNYETLSDAAGRTLYFLLKVKCQAVARDIGVSIGANVLV